MSISLKLINGGPNKVRGSGKNRKIHKQGEMLIWHGKQVTRRRKQAQMGMKPSIWRYVARFRKVISQSTVYRKMCINTD